AGARAAGLSVERIAPADDAAPLLLLPSSERAARWRAEQRLTRRLTIGAASVWLAAGALFAFRLAWERRAVEREFAAPGRPPRAVRCGGRPSARRAGRARDSRWARVGAVHPRVRSAPGSGKRGAVPSVTQRDRRALVVGGSVIGGAVLLLRVAPWAFKTAE